MKAGAKILNTKIPLFKFTWLAHYEIHSKIFTWTPYKDNFAAGECNFLKLEDNLIIAYIDADEFEITIELDQPDLRKVWDLKTHTFTK